MKVGCFISDVSSGGGNHLTKDFIINISRLQSNSIEIVLIASTNIYKDFIKQKNFKYNFFKVDLMQKILFKLHTKKTVSKILNFFNIMNPLERFVLKNKIDLLIFNSPSIYSLYARRINYVACIWNTEIRQYKNFPEFKNGAFEQQEKLIKEITRNAFKVIVFTNQNKKDLVDIYNCSSKKIILQNLKPTLPKIYEDTHNKYNYLKEFKKLKLSKKKIWIFYPAQFWFHKNHTYIINSLKYIDHLKMKNVNFVFCGRDKGYLAQIKEKIKKNNFGSRFRIFNYLRDSQVISLYLYSDAIVMPTHLGRSSMPLLESFYFNKKIFYSSRVLDKKFYSYVDKVDLDRPGDFSNKLYSFLKNRKKLNNVNHLKKIYHKECSDHKFLGTYKKIINDFKIKKIN
jgi:hypothetical protein